MSCRTNFDLLIQTKDDRRNLTVTGVKKCALPIYWQYTAHHASPALAFHSAPCSPCIGILQRTRPALYRYSTAHHARPASAFHSRSEELRVWQEFRYRFSPQLLIQNILISNILSLLLSYLISFISSYLICSTLL